MHSLGVLSTRGVEYPGKRAVDLFGSTVILAVFFPALVLIALIIKATSRGPVLIRQRRVGLEGSVFLMYKFRTMCEQAEQALASGQEALEWDGPIFRVKGDRRITPVGRVLRRYSLDELPQLFNVLRGEMSLVGPRPHLVEEAMRYELWHRRRLACRSGLTCFWQASPSRHEVPFAEWIEMDLRYVEECSLWLDLRLLARTVGTILRAK